MDSTSDSCCSHRQNSLRTPVTISVIGLGFFALACIGDAGESPHEGDRPTGSHDVISDDHLDMMEEAGVEIHPGADPPQDVVGGWLQTERTVTYDEDSDGEMVGRSRGDMEFYFFDLRGGEIQVETRQVDGGEGEGEGAFISGADGCFTIYAGSTLDDERCLQELAEVFSGCVDGDQIHDLQRALMVLETEEIEDGGCDTVIEREAVRIVSSEESAERIE